MSHYHMEIVLAPGDDYEARIEQAMKPFCEHDDEANHAFWDWYVIGGRWSGDKLEAQAPEGAIDKFHAELSRREVTVSGLQMGKQTLEPASQIPEVDALWREMVPGCGDVCTLFDHYEGNAMDVCPVSEVSESVTAAAFGVIVPFEFRGDVTHEFKQLQFTSLWNGASWQDTDFDGDVCKAIRAWNADISERAADEYVQRARVTDDWLCVTIDYHS